MLTHNIACKCNPDHKSLSVLEFVDSLIDDLPVFDDQRVLKNFTGLSDDQGIDIFGAFKRETLRYGLVKQRRSVVDNVVHDPFLEIDRIVDGCRHGSLDTSVPVAADVDDQGALLHLLEIFRVKNVVFSAYPTEQR